MRCAEGEHPVEGRSIVYERTIGHSGLVFRKRSTRLDLQDAAHPSLSACLLSV